MDFGRVITAMVTPFDAALEVDWEQTGKLIDYLIEEQGSDALVVCGTTGESPTLTDNEKITLYNFAVERAAGRCRIIAGTGSNDTRHSIHLSQEAERAGADGLLLVAPYYNRPTQEGLYRHFRAIAESVSLPVMLYNVPKRTGVTISAETTIRLSEIPNITSTKEASGDLELISAIAAGTPDDFIVYCGDDSLTLPILAVGGHGVVSVASHFAGRRMKDMIDSFFSGDSRRAAHLHGKLMPLFTGLFALPNPTLVKSALNALGVGVGGLRLPLVEAGDSDRDAILRVVERLQHQAAK